MQGGKAAAHRHARDQAAAEARRDWQKCSVMVASSRTNSLNGLQIAARLIGLSIWMMVSQKRKLVRAKLVSGSPLSAKWSWQRKPPSS